MDVGAAESLHQPASITQTAHELQARLRKECSLRLSGHVLWQLALDIHLVAAELR